MKSVKTGGTTHGNGLTPKRSKHDVNLPKNGFLRFQVGLLFSLVVVYVMLQWTFRVTEVEPVQVASLPEEIVEFTMGEVVAEPEKQAEKIAPVQVAAVVDPQVFKVISNAAVMAETKTASRDDMGKELEAGDIPDVPADLPPIHVNVVEFAPVFPGCDVKADNKERIDCMNEQMNRYIRKYFDSSVAAEYGLQGTLRIWVQFTIGADGVITDVQVRAPHPALEREVFDLVQRFPRMRPGMQGAQPVKVSFMKPIIFSVQ